VTRGASTVLPNDIQARFGKKVATTFNGDYLEIPIATEGEIVANAAGWLRGDARR
jgi:hypothetical protein